MVRSLALSLLLLAAGSAAGQSGEAVRTYLGPHPIDRAGNWHAGGEAHEHGQLVSGEAAFGAVGEIRVFLADPVAWGWTGAVWIYDGRHPVGDLAYCGLSGEHAHPFAPEGTYREVRAGVYRFTGALRGGRPVIRPARVRPARPLVTADSVVATPAPLVVGGGFLGAPFSGAPFLGDPACRGHRCVEGARARRRRPRPPAPAAVPAAPRPRHQVMRRTPIESGVITRIRPTRGGTQRRR
jgi:hypothetical protein